MEKSYTFQNRVDIFLLIILLFFVLILSPEIAHAQILTDGSIGTQTTLAGPDYKINASLGQMHGNNLYHSFSTFDINSGETATFSGPDNVSNVISRVTGSSGTTINGLLECTIPEANFYFLNPNGIIFGPDAIMDIKGSFFFSTADYIRFSDNYTFDANLNQPSVLSSAPPAAFGFLKSSPSKIQITDAYLDTYSNKSMSFIGGDVNISNSLLNAPGGQIDLVCAQSVGEVALENPSTEMSTVTSFGTTSIDSNSLVTTTGGNGGTIRIRTGKLIMDYSSIEASNQSDQNGDKISINAQEDISLQNDASIISYTESSGDGPDIEIISKTLSLTQGSSISGTNEGSGNVGALSIDAAESIDLSGKDSNGINSYIGSITNNEGHSGSLTIKTGRLTMIGGDLESGSLGTGDAGDIDINATKIELLNGARINAASYDSGDAGDISITASDSISLTGANDQGISSRILNSANGSGGSGNMKINTPDLFMDNGVLDSISWGMKKAGDIEIEADRVVVKNGGSIASNANSSGYGGNILIQADHYVHLDGKGSDGLYSSINAYSTSSGHAGKIEIYTPELVLSEGAIEAASMDEGCAGDISILTASISMSNQSYITSTTFYTGNGGNIDIGATQKIDITDNITGISCGTSGTGDSGKITINTQELNISNNGGIYASTFAQGDAGDIDITANSIIVDGSESSIFTRSLDSGLAGNVTIDTGQLRLLNGGQINTTSMDIGDGGDVSIHASDGVWMSDKSSIITSTRIDGDAGRIVIDSPICNLTQGSAIQTETFGKGEGGDVGIYVNDLNIESFSQIRSGATIYIDDSHLLIGTNNGGDITIQAQNKVSIKGQDTGISSMTFGPGKGGDINICAPFIELIGSGGLTSSSVDLYEQGVMIENIEHGNAGDIKITENNTLISNGGLIEAFANKAADGGNIEIHSNSLVYLKDSEISTNVGGDQNTTGGNISIYCPYIIFSNQRTIANAYEGTGGNIAIDANFYLVDPYSVVNASSELGTDGTVDIQAPIISLGGVLSPLPKNFLIDEQLWMDQCQKHLRDTEKSSLNIFQSDGMPLTPEGYIPVWIPATSN